MSDRLLTSVIELETALQEEVHREDARAAAWQRREITAMDRQREEIGRETTRLAQEKVNLARQQATAEGEALRAAAALRCARLDALPESFLTALLLHRLATLLPEVGDDHPHGEG